MPEDRPPQAAPLPTTHSPPEAERRQLTVMFCDVVDSTKLSRQLDPEEYRDVVRAYQQVCFGVIQRYEGYIAQYLGDGLLVYFGYPQAHEDDAHRAVRAGLGVLEAMTTLNAHLEQERGVQLAVRVGMHTGLVVVGPIGNAGRQEQLALGDTPNIAARIQAMALPNTLLMSAATAHLVHGYFVCQERGEQTLRGVTPPILVYQILHESGAHSRMEIVTPRGLTPLVGRDSEVTLLLEHWTLAKGGTGQAVLLRGEPGIGKSRLVQVLKDHVTGEIVTRHECRCSPYHTQSAFYPLTEPLLRLLHWQRGDTADEKFRKLETVLAQTSVQTDKAVPLLASLLALPIPENRYPPLYLSPTQQRQHTLEALLALFLGHVTHYPVLFIVEDLQWIDPSTLEFLDLLLGQAPTASLLAVLTCRLEFQLPWGERPHFTLLDLQRLPRLVVERMMTHLTGGKRLPAAVIHHVVEKTDGVPLFVEELTQTVLESGLLRETVEHYELAGPLSAVSIPATLQGALMARLDRLAPIKAIAQLGATLGREFTYELIHAVAPVEEATLQQGLAQLVEADLLYQRGCLPHATYVFKHALLQDTAYQSLLKSTRQQYHQRIAQVMETQFPVTAEIHPELVAQHYTAAGLTQQAIAFWQRAVQRAVQRSAFVEAVAHLTKGLGVLTMLPDTPERAQQELLLQTKLGPALMAVKGQGAWEVGQAYCRARQLCEQVGETPQLFPVLWGLWRFYNVRAEHQMAQELGTRLVSLAQDTQDPTLLLQAYMARGASLLWLGVLPAALDHLRRGMALAGPLPGPARTCRDGTDLGPMYCAYAALALWELGYPEQALQQSHEAVSRARQLAHPFSLVQALHWAAQLHQFRREEEAVQQLVEEMLALSLEQGYTLYAAAGTIRQGWVLTVQGQGQAGIAQMHRGLTAVRATGAVLRLPMILGSMAEAYGRMGWLEDGLHLLAEALSIVDKTGERWWEAELHRLKGEMLLLLHGTHQAEAITCLQHALTIARRQQAKSLELRAATSLSRLWQQQNRRTAARQLLREVYNWFTEGGQTVDQQEARALLLALGGRRSGSMAR